MERDISVIDRKTNRYVELEDTYINSKSNVCVLMLENKQTNKQK